METHYYKSTQIENRHLFSRGYSFFVEYLQHILDGKKKPFLTPQFVSLSVNALPFAFAMLDLPLSSANSKQQHKFKSDKKRGIVVTAGSNLIIFKKEIKEGEQKLKNDIMVTHRYQSLLQNNLDNEIEDFLINHPYQCEIIMTNVSPKSKRVTLLF